MSELTMEIYADVDGKWKWALKDTNNKTILASSRGYETKEECQKRVDALEIFLPIATTSIIKDSQERGVIGYTKQVFFSHSSKDEELVSLIRLVFEFTPIKPYFARLEKAGANPADKIVNEIGNSKALFALITSNVFANTETLFWVLFEVGAAKGKDKPVYAWIEQGTSVPQCVTYITDYEKFKPKDYTDRHKVVREMLSVALKL